MKICLYRRALTAVLILGYEVVRQCVAPIVIAAVQCGCSFSTHSPPFGGLLQEAFRKAATAALTKRLQSSVAAATAAAGSELDSLFNIQAQLTE